LGLSIPIVRKVVIRIIEETHLEAYYLVVELVEGDLPETKVTFRPVDLVIDQESNGGQGHIGSLFLTWVGLVGATFEQIHVPIIF